MPWLLDAADRDALQRELLGATRERMLREMAERSRSLTADAPLVLVLEDLHWSDSSTLDLLAVLARRREPARLLLVGTYRPVDGHPAESPVRELTLELGAGACQELSLELLGARRSPSTSASGFPAAHSPASSRASSTGAPRAIRSSW